MHTLNWHYIYANSRSRQLVGSNQVGSKYLLITRSTILIKQ